MGLIKAGELINAPEKEKSNIRDDDRFYEPA